MTGRASVTGVHYDVCYERHNTGPGHPESAARYRVLREALETLPKEIVRLPGRTATVEEVLLAHEALYHDMVFRDVEDFKDVLRTGDTAICIDSYEVALEASGAVLAAVDAVMRGEVRRAFCAVRPPGHHATADRGMGFCVFNNVAIAANYLRKNYGVERVAIVDWDVHHGNGTEEIFAEEPNVYYLSFHENGSYPHTGGADFHGTGEGVGTTLNCPLPFGSTGGLALEIWDEVAGPELEKFRPDFVLISAGFDARQGDPLGGLQWADETFAGLTRRVVGLAERFAGGRLVSVLEGGYDPAGLASAALAHVNAMR